MNRNALGTMIVASLNQLELSGSPQSCKEVVGNLVDSILVMVEGSKPATNFEKVAKMNLAFHNAKGDPHNTDWEKLSRVVVNIRKECDEIDEAIAEKNLDGVRDGLIDVHVFGYGGHHFLGYNADADMDAVLEGNYTRLCKTQEELHYTMIKYRDLGVAYYIEGEFPTVCLKSSFDQGNGEYPKGKFLKSAFYKEPVFYQEPAPVNVVKDMAAERAKLEKETADKRERIEKQVAEYRSRLEEDAFGLPAYRDENGIGGSLTTPK